MLPILIPEAMAFLHDISIPIDIAWATFLPPGNLVRRILAAAPVEGYLRDESYKFVQETLGLPSELTYFKG